MKWPWRKKKQEPAPLDTLQVSEHFLYCELDMLIEAGKLFSSPRYRHLQNCEACQEKLKSLGRGRGLIMD